MAVRSLRLPVNRRALAWLLCPAAKRHTRHSALPPQPALIGGRFDPPSAGPGLAQGVARLISKPEDAGQLSDGDIRVTTVTNIGWTPIFPGGRRRGHRRRRSPVPRRSRGTRAQHLAIVGGGNAGDTTAPR